MRKINFDRFTFLGIFVLLSVFLNQLVNYQKYHDPLEILWFCDMAAVFLGLGLLWKNKAIVTMVMVMAIPAQAMWIVDFFRELFGTGAGRTAELFSFGPMVFWLSTNLHAILIPISLYAVWKLGFEKRSFWWGILFIFFLNNATFFFTSSADNKNCAFFSCDQKNPGSGYIEHFFFRVLIFWELVYLLSFLFFKKLFGLFGKKFNPKQ